MFIQEDYFKNIFNTVREAILILDENMRVLSANRSFFTIFKVDSATTIGSLLYDLGNGQWNIPYLRVLLEDVLPKNDTVDDYKIEHTFESIGQKTMLLNACKIREKKNDLPIILLAIEDITEHKRLEDLLTESEERYRRIFETASDGIVLLEKNEGHIVNANPAAEKMLGYSEEEYTGKMLQDIGVSLDMRDFPAIMQSLKRSGILNYDDVPVKTRSGQDIYTDIYMVDRAKLAQCNIRDVSERKRTMDALLESQKILEGIINAMPVRVYWKDKNLVYLGCNAAFARDAGFAASKDIIGKDDYQMGWRDQAELYRSDDRQIIESGGSKFLIEEPQTTPEGNTITVLTRKMPLLSSNGEIIGVLGTYMDVTDLEHAEQAFLLSEKKYRDLLETINLVAVMLDRNGNIFFCNDYLLHLFGWTRDEVLNKSWFDLFLPDDERKTAFSKFTSGIEEGVIPAHDENLIIMRDGNKKHIEWNNSILWDSKGKVIGVARIGSDVTEHRKLEAQLRQSQKMEAVGTLAGGIAHDFNNILSVIIGYGHIILMKMTKDDPQRVNIEHILEAGERAAQLTKSLLLFSRKQISERKPVDLNEIIRTVDKFLKRVIGEDVECRTSLFEEGLPILGDAHQIEQVLMNLATNARDAMSAGGLFTIATEQVWLDEAFITLHGYGKPGIYGLITISDTGKGMDAVTREHIFEPFYTTKEVGKGTGLGLSMAYGIVKQHEGFITVYSEPGQGTSFKIYLPLISASVEEEKKLVEERPRGGTETILLAEDDETVRTITRSILEEVGYTVIAAVDGQDGVNKFKENKDSIKLLLFDIIMPKKTGKEAYDEIRVIQPDIKILFQSGYAPDLVREKLLLEDTMPVVFKPVTPMMLLKQVRSVLDQVT